MTFEDTIDVDSDLDIAVTPRRSVALENDEDMGSPLTSLSDEDADEDGEVNNTKIPKPAGEAGRPQSGGYNLQEKLDWNDKTYESVVVSMSKVYMKKNSDR